MKYTHSFRSFILILNMAIPYIIRFINMEQEGILSDIQNLRNTLKGIGFEDTSECSKSFICKDSLSGSNHPCYLNKNTLPSTHQVETGTEDYSPCDFQANIVMRDKLQANHRSKPTSLIKLSLNTPKLGKLTRDDNFKTELNHEQSNASKTRNELYSSELPLEGGDSLPLSIADFESTEKSSNILGRISDTPTIKNVAIPPMLIKHAKRRIQISRDKNRKSSEPIVNSNHNTPCSKPCLSAKSTTSKVKSNSHSDVSNHSIERINMTSPLVTKAIKSSLCDTLLSPISHHSTSASKHAKTSKESLISRIEELEAQIRKYQNVKKRVELLDASNSQLITSNDMLKWRLHEHNEETTKFRDKLVHFQKENSRLVKEVGILTEAIRSKDQMINHLEDKFENLSKMKQSEINKDANKGDENTLSVEDKNTLHKYREENTKLKIQLAKFSERIYFFTEQKKTLKETMTKVESDFKRELDESFKKSAKYQHSLEIALEQGDRLKNQLSTILNENKKILADNNDLREKLERLNKNNHTSISCSNSQVEPTDKHILNSIKNRYVY